MTWQLASFALVAGALAVSFWWYERSRPPAKLVAVVATLAALAALGRDAFAAVPDVKPITAIVLVSGLAFGARPGFAVGAIGALASNVLLGEGPWTPWQMLGWGLVGLAGAALGALIGRRPPALALAVAAAAAAELFNLVVDAYTWTGTGDHTLAAFGVVLGSALPFDLTHVVASFVFALAFGPVLLRMLTRVRGRLEVRWAPAAEVPEPRPPRPARPAAGLGLPPTALVALACGAVLVLGLSACASASTDDQAGASATTAGGARAARVAIGGQLAYLTRAQNSDGGFGAAPGQASSELYTAWAALGLAAAGRDPAALRRDGHSVLDALRAEATTLQGAGDLERTILALAACGAPVHSLPGGDPVQRLLRYRRGDGSFGGLSNLTAFAILALRAAGEAPRAPVLASAARWLARQQEGDGGFGFGAKGGGSDIDDTAAVVQALIAARRPGGPATVRRATAYLIGSQALDGGFPQERGGASNAQSTAWAVQALVAARHPVESVRRGAGRSPLGYLESLVSADGSMRYSRTGAQTPVWVTAQALTALAERPLPIAPAG